MVRMGDSKLQIIFKAWENVVVENPVVEETAEKRAKVCSNCMHAKQSIIRIFVNEKLTSVDGMKCSKCKCPLIAKIRSKDKCPLGKW